MPATAQVGLAGVSRPLTELHAPMQPKESAIPSMARALLRSRHCILTEPRMLRSSTSDSCTDYASRPHWDFAADLLLNAAQTRKRSDIEMATAQMERALRVEG